MRLYAGGAVEPAGVRVVQPNTVQELWRPRPAQAPALRTA